MVLSFTGCEQMMTRNSSFRQFTLSDLCLNMSHVPNQGGAFDDAMISIVYRKGIYHKERQSITRVVGAWRHQNWLQCFSGMLYMVMLSGYYSDPNLHFLRPKFEARPYWWSIPLIQGWNNMQSANAVYRGIFNAT